MAIGGCYDTHSGVTDESWALRPISSVDLRADGRSATGLELHIRGLLVQLCSHWRRFIGGLTAAVLAAVLLAAPALAVGTLELNPSQGAAGDEFLISGHGFEASEQVKLKWNGSPIGPPVRADADGEFTTTRTVPIDALPGNHTVTAIGLQSGLRAEAFFRVIDPAATTTTTAPTTTATTTTAPTTTAPTTTAPTTTAPTTTVPTTTGPTTTGPTTTAQTTTGPTTTSTPPKTAITTADGKTTTTSSDTATDKDGSLVVTEFRIEPAEATPGSQVEIEGELKGKLSKVQFWLDGQRLGTPLAVEEDGSFRTTRTLPDLSPDIYWLTLKAPNGQVLATRKLEIITAVDPTSTGAGFESSGDSDLSDALTTPVGLASFVGMPLVVAIAVWWMWRRPSDDEKESPQ